MTRRPSIQVYPADWRKDTELQSCSLTARGLWWEMITIAHECEPYGELRVNGKPMTEAQIARHVGISARECATLLEELFDAGVPSRTEDGAIYSRRMVRDAEQREKWRDRQETHRETARRQKDDVTRDVTQESPRSSSSSSTSVDSSVPSESKTPADRASKAEPDGFAEFYAAYPKHVGRDAAIKAYRGALKRAAAEEILAGARRYAEERAGEDPKFTKQPSTWLNGGHWADEPTKAHAETMNGHGNAPQRPRSGDGRRRDSELAGALSLIAKKRRIAGGGGEEGRADHPDADTPEPDLLASGLLTRTG